MRPDRVLVALVLGTSCTTASHVQAQLAQVQGTLAAADRVYATRCAPVALANAQAHAAFSSLELRQGDPTRARQHADQALTHAIAALEEATPCGGVDTDRDHVADIVDACVDVPEDLDGDRDDDGCPEDDLAPVAPVEPADEIPVAVPEPAPAPEPRPQPAPAPDPRPAPAPAPAPTATPAPVAITKVVVTATRLELRDAIRFEPASAVLLPSSYPVLDDVAEALKADPEPIVRVEGHTDSAGSEATNLQLSKERAEAVIDYLVGAGIPRPRMRAVGFGESRPVDTNRTSTGRARNRRVEFHFETPPEAQD